MVAGDIRGAFPPCAAKMEARLLHLGLSLTPSEGSIIVKRGRWSTPPSGSPHARLPGRRRSSLVKGGIEGS